MPFEKVAATLAITPQGARKTIAQRMAEKLLEMNAASQLNYTAPLFTDVQQTQQGSTCRSADAHDCTGITNTRRTRWLTQDGWRLSSL